MPSSTTRPLLKMQGISSRLLRLGFGLALLATLLTTYACDAQAPQDRVAAGQRSGLEVREPVDRVEIRGQNWYLNGEITYKGAAAEGLLMNVRMVNAVFEDRNRPRFDPERNLGAFLRALPDYAGSGIRAITLSLQGGFPGYEGALNSAFDADGGLRPSYLARVSRAIDAARDEGVVVILGLFYQRQSAVLRDEAAIRRAVVETVRWIRDQNFRNVVVEIANEYGHKRFAHEILRTPHGQAELIRLARESAPELLISTSGGGHGRLHPQVALASDFLLIHFNRTQIANIPERVADLRLYGKPIVCNEDDKIGSTGARAAEVTVQNRASWGFMHNRRNQYWPFEFSGTKDDAAVYTTIRALTAPPASTPTAQVNAKKVVRSMR